MHRAREQRHAEYVDVFAGRVGHDLALGHGLERLERVAEMRRPLELLRLRRLLHQPLRALDERAVITFEICDETLDAREVLLGGDGPRAEPAALADMVIEAWPQLRRVAPSVEDGERFLTRAVLDEVLNHVERAARVHGPQVRPEIQRPVLCHVADDLDGGVRIFGRYAHVHVTLVVLHEDVVLRAEFLDEVGLQYQRLQLARHHRPIDVAHALDERQFPRTDVLIHLHGYVAAEAGAKVFGLANVQNTSFVIQPTINPRIRRGFGHARPKQFQGVRRRRGFFRRHERHSTPAGPRPTIKRHEPDSSPCKGPLTPL